MRLSLSATLLVAMLAGGSPAAADGAKTYAAQCSVCHQVGGVGQPGVYPRLAGRTADIAKTPKGRQLMISALLFGMAGKLEIDGQSIMGVMPAFSRLSDAEVAEVLTYVSALGGGKAPRAFVAEEVSAVRAGPKMTPTAVNAVARGVASK